jgi:hypothetical protein
VAIFSLVVVLACLIAILLFVVRAGRPRSGATTRWRAIADYATPKSIGGLIGGGVATLAIGSVVPSASAGAVGSGLGILLALLSARSVKRLRNGVLGLCGVVGITGTAYSFFNGSGCSTTPILLRIALIVFLTTTAVVGALAGIVRGRFTPSSVLALFGVATVINFVASPLGISLLELPWYAWPAALMVALVFGFGAGFAPDFTIAMSGFAIGLAVVGASAAVGSTCNVGSDPSRLILLVSYCAVYAISRTSIKLLTRV